MSGVLQAGHHSPNMKVVTMSDWVFGIAVRKNATDHVVSVRDVPEVVTSGDDLAEALGLALDAIEVSIGARIVKGEPLPATSPVLDGEHALALSARMAAKASVYEAWRSTGISKTELARRMGRSEVEVRRILDPGHGTRIDQLEEAAKALGGRLAVSFAEGEAPRLPLRRRLDPSR